VSTPEPVWRDPRVRRGLEQQFAARRDELDGGARSLGWKTGLATAAAMTALKTTGALVGYLTDATHLPSGALIEIGGWVKPVLEPEIAVRMSAGLAPGASREQAAAAVDALAAAIEVVDINLPPDDPEQILAGNIFHRAVILGPFDPSRVGAVTDGISLSVNSGEQVVAEADDPLANVGDLLDVVRHVAAVVGNSGGKLAAGDVIITGSAVPALRLSEGRYEVRYENLGSVSVQVTDAA
jgi:2-keto-4-pentenoate hydratase